MKKLNDMCKNCISLYSGDCTGDHTDIYTGCIYRKLPEMEKMQDNRKFKLALMIPGFLYYVDETEPDENTNTMIIRLQDGSIISNNYFAYSAMMEDLGKIHKGEIEKYFMPGWFKKIYDQNEKEGYFDE